MPLIEQDPRIEVKRDLTRFEGLMAVNWPPTATAGRRNRVRESHDVSLKTIISKPGIVGDQIQPRSGASLQSTKRDNKKSAITTKQALSDLARLPKEDREKLVAKIANRQNAVQATRDMRIKRFREQYTEPWELVRETRSKAAEEMIRAAKAEALQRNFATKNRDPKAIVPKNEHIPSPVLLPRKTTNTISNPSFKPAIAVNAARKETKEGSSRPQVRFQANLQAERVGRLAAQPGRLDARTTTAPVEGLQKQPFIPWPLLYDAQDKAAGKISRNTRVKTYSRPAFKPQVPDFDESEVEPTPEEDLPQRQWKASDPALDPDSLTVRYAQLEAANYSELDRDESRQLFKAKQKQLKNERERKWWERGDDAIPEDRWQRFARDTHPGKDASTEELHQHYRMIHQTVPHPTRENRKHGHTDVKYNKKRAPAMPTLDESSRP